MKALVVGGNGFIGSHLVDRLIGREWEVTVLDVQDRRYDLVPDGVHFIRGSIEQPYLLREALLGVDVVYHLAWATVHEISNQDPAADVRANLIPSLHLLEAAQQAGVQRVIFTSSGGTVYGPAQTLPIPESHPKRPINAYGITKLTFEHYLQMFRHLYGLDYAVFRPSVPYGPRQNPLGRQGAVAVFLYRVAHEQPVTIWGDGETVRDFFFVSDLASAMVAGATGELVDERIFNIGGGRGVSLNELLRLVEGVVGKRARVTYLPAREFDAPRVVLDTTRAAQVLGWAPDVEMGAGLARTWHWMQRNIP